MDFVLPSMLEAPALLNVAGIRAKFKMKTPDQWIGRSDISFLLITLSF